MAKNMHRIYSLGGGNYIDPNPTRGEARADAAIERDRSIAERNKVAAKRDKAAVEWNKAAAKREEAQTALIEAVTARIAQGGDLDKGIIEALKAALHGRQ